MAFRSRTSLVRLLLTSVLPALSIALLFGCAGEDIQEVETPTAEPAAPAVHVVGDTLTSGQSLYSSLVGGGLDASHVVRVLDVLGELVNLRSCKPGDSYTAEVSEEGAILSLCYKKGLRELYHVGMDSSGYAATSDEIPVTGVTRRVEGVLESCLWEAFLEAGEDPQIALKLSDVLGWEIDFVTDPRTPSRSSSRSFTARAGRSAWATS
jgi:hypothetical protein